MDDLFQSIKKLYENAELRAKLAGNAFSTVQKYDEKKLVHDYENVYTEVMKN